MEILLITAKNIKHSKHTITVFLYLILICSKIKYHSWIDKAI